MLLTFNISLDLFALLINSAPTSVNQDSHCSFEVYSRGGAYWKEGPKSNHCDM